MDGADEHSNRILKTESRDRSRRFVQGTRAYLHSLTNSRVRRSREVIERADRRPLGKDEAENREAR